jgi:hypothetical protein
MLATIRALLLAAPVALAVLHGAPAEAGAGRFTKTLVTFNEIYAVDADSASGKVRVEARIPVDPTVTAAFDASTPFSASLGGFSVSGVLGDDPSYVPGKSSATLTEDALDGSGRVLLAKIRWTDRQMIVRITSVTGGDRAPVIADTYSMEDSGPVYDNRAAQVSVGGVTANWDLMACAGHVYTWSWRGEDFSIVRMHGRAAH